MRRLYLTLYDYQTGGVWTYLRAESAEQIKTKFPMLTVYEEPPTWMTESERREIELNTGYDVESAATDDPKFMGGLLRSRPGDAEQSEVD
jgi:hypothetical protein